MNDTMGIETTEGGVLLVVLDEGGKVISFLDDNDRLVRSYRLETLATVTTGLVLDEDAKIIIPADAVAAVKQWARLA